MSFLHGFSGERRFLEIEVVLALWRALHVVPACLQQLIFRATFSDSQPLAKCHSCNCTGSIQCFRFFLWRTLHGIQTKTDSGELWWNFQKEREPARTLHGNNHFGAYVHTVSFSHVQTLFPLLSPLESGQNANLRNIHFLKFAVSSHGLSAAVPPRYQLLAHSQFIISHFGFHPWHHLLNRVQT